MFHNESIMESDATGISWVNKDERKTVSDIIDDTVPPSRYTLPSRSIIEEQINNIKTNYLVPVELEETLNQLVFNYNLKVEAALKATKRWQTERGRVSWAAHALLYMEQPEAWAALECLQELAEANEALYQFILQLKEVKIQPIPVWLEGVLHNQR